MSDNGILGQVPGQYVSEGSKGLPNPEKAEDREYRAEIEAGHAGRVRIIYKRQIAKKGKHSHYFWLAHRAERVES